MISNYTAYNWPDFGAAIVMQNVNNSLVENLTVHDNSVGVLIRGYNNVVSNCTIENNTGLTKGPGSAGILFNGVYGTIKRNDLWNNSVGISVSPGNPYMETINNTVHNNTVNSSIYGILLYNTSNNTVTNNTVNNNDNSIYLINASNDNNISNNVVCSSTNFDFNLTSNSHNNSGDNICNASKLFDEDNNDVTCLWDCNGQPNCGATINSDLTLSKSLTCSGTALHVGADNITLDGNECTITGNSNGSGVNITARNNVSVTNCMVSNFAYGIYLYNSNNTTLTSITASNNQHGIYLNSSSNNTLTSNNASLNDYYGILFSSSSHNELTGNTANNNGEYGIYLNSSSNNTLISGNLVCFNSNSDINLTSDSVNNSGSNVFDTIYDGDNNSVTKSQSCSSYYCGDGICQSWESCSSCSSDCGTCDTNGRSGGGGGGGGSISLPPPLTAPSDFQETMFKFFQADEAKLIEMASQVQEQTGITEIQATLDQRMSASATVSKVSSLPTEIPAPEGEAYGYFEIVFTQYGTQTQVEPSGYFEHKISKDWFNQKDATPKDIQFLKHKGDTWVELSSDQLDEDSQYIYFKVNFDSTSLFAVTIETQPSAPTPTPTPSTPEKEETPAPVTTLTPTPAPTSTPEPQKEMPWTITGGVIGILVVAAIVALYYVKVRK